VLEILSHVNKRVKLQPQIGLPLSDLWKLYSESGAVPIIRNFCIVYIEMAFQRVNAKVIGECHSAQIGDEVAAKYKKVNNSQDRKLFIEFCLHTILYQRVSQRYGTGLMLKGAYDI
ncbi:Proteasome-associated protein ECM29-like protein, partial [Mucuna pruriens]